MKILHVTNNWPTEKNPVFGIFVKEQVDSLRDIGVESDIFFINGREQGKLTYARAIRKLKKALTQKEYDIVHCHHALSAIVAILTGFDLRKKMIVSYQNEPKHELGNIAYWALRHYATRIITKTKHMRMIHHGATYLPNGVNTDFFREIDKLEARKKLSLPENEKLVLFVSSNFIRKQKRHDRFLDVIRVAMQKHHDLIIKEIVLTNTPRHLIPFYINAADVHLLTSDFEGSPNSIKECLACNIPIVATPVGDVQDLLDGVEGVYVSKTFNIYDLAELLVIAFKRGRIDGRKRLNEMQLDKISVANRLKQLYTEVNENYGK